MILEPPNMETEFAPLRGVAVLHERAAENWRKAMRCHALMWKRQRGTLAGAMALHSAGICWAMAGKARSAAALEVLSERGGCA